MTFKSYLEARTGSERKSFQIKDNSPLEQVPPLEYCLSHVLLVTVVTFYISFHFLSPGPPGQIERVDVPGGDSHLLYLFCTTIKKNKEM